MTMVPMRDPKAVRGVGLRTARFQENATGTGHPCPGAMPIFRAEAPRQSRARLPFAARLPIRLHQVGCLVLVLLLLLVVLPFSARAETNAVGFNYFHETWTDPWSPVGQYPPVQLPKDAQQRQRDFRLMKQLGATAVRIHGGNNVWVFDAVQDAHAHGLTVWLSYRPNMRDFDIGQKVDEANPGNSQHPASPTLDFCRDEFAGLISLRTRFREDFLAFVKESANFLKPGDCLVVANELLIDLGYRYDKQLGYDKLYDRPDFPSEQKLLIQLLSYARGVWGEEIKLTYATYSGDRSKQQWAEMQQAGDGLRLIELRRLG